MKIPGFVWLLGLALPALTVGCGKTEPPAVGNSAAPHPHPHQHVAPHGGTPVELGKEEFHLEFVLDDHAGKLSAYVLDGEMEKFIRVPAPGFTVSAKLSDRVETLNFKAVPNTATGETIGDTSLFETQADWLKTTKTFDGTLAELTIRSRRYAALDFNFPKGNDHD